MKVRQMQKIKKLSLDSLFKVSMAEANGKVIKSFKTSIKTDDYNPKYVKKLFHKVKFKIFISLSFLFKPIRFHKSIFGTSFSLLIKDIT